MCWFTHKECWSNYFLPQQLAWRKKIQPPPGRVSVKQNPWRFYFHFLKDTSEIFQWNLSLAERAERTINRFPALWIDQRNFNFSLIKQFLSFSDFDGWQVEDLGFTFLWYDFFDICSSRGWAPLYRIVPHIQITLEDSGQNSFKIDSIHQTYQFTFL